MSYYFYPFILIGIVIFLSAFFIPSEHGNPQIKLTGWVGEVYTISRYEIHRLTYI